jgi:hypothetical protein
VDRERKTAWLVLIVLAGFIVAVVAHYIVAQFAVRGYPYSTFLYLPDDSNGGGYPGQPNVLGVHRFGDFFETWINSRGPHPYTETPLGVSSSYFPLTHVLMFPLAQLSLSPALVLYLLAFLVFAGTLIHRHVGGDRLRRAQAVIVLTACSTPVLFLLDRGNVEGVVFAALACSVLAYRRDRFYLAALLLAIPVAMKGAAGVFWLLFLFDGRLRELLASMAASAFLTLGALLALPGSTEANVEGLRGALESISAATTEGTAAALHSVSLNAALTAVGRWDDRFDVFVSNYAFVGLAVLLGVALVLAVLRPVLWQRVALVCGVMLLVPSISYEYRMLHLYIPLVLFLAAGEARRSDPLFVVLFGLLLVPKGLPILFDDVSLGSLVNPLLLVALMAAVVVDAALDERARSRLRAIAAFRHRRRALVAADPS